MDKWNSRKLAVAVGSMLGIPMFDLPSESWYLSIVYILVQAIVDVVAVISSKERKNVNP